MNSTALSWTRESDSPAHLDWQVTAAERLVAVVEELSHQHDLPGIMKVVRLAARDLTGADGATFVLRDGDKCFYAEENAIKPLWKGQRFPMQICISGWAMMHAESVVIEDIYADPRIPADAYRPTFVKSLVMVPIRKDRPVGAIGNYWATQRQPQEHEVAILRALATATAVAMENADLYNQLQLQIRALERSNEELERFAWAASHDLKSPLRAIDSLSSWVIEDAGEQLSPTSRGHLQAMRQRVRRMEQMLDVVLEYAESSEENSEVSAVLINGEQMLEAVMELVHLPAGFSVLVTDAFKQALMPRMPLQRVFCNLVDNAIKHHDQQHGTVTLGVENGDSQYQFTVMDDGPGIHPEYQQKVFEMFRTLKRRDAREGSGMGLTIVKRILEKHGQSIAVTSGDGRGATLAFTWPRPLQEDRA